MSYAIFVRDLHGPTVARSYVLACEITRRNEAEEMVDRLASSYEEHGINTETMVHWFRDAQGMHTIWVQRASQPARTLLSASHRRALFDRSISEQHMRPSVAAPSPALAEKRAKQKQGGEACCLADRVRVALSA
jgi:hypothetical protein